MSFFRGEAERLAEEGGSAGIIYAVEEPETSQHTNNQKILIEAFKEMSNLSGVQVLLTTHSAYMVKQLDFDNLKVINNSNKDNEKILNVAENYLKYPSLNEVNYLAFDEVNEEYHNELYGALQEIAIDEEKKNAYEKGFEKWLATKGLEQNIPYIRENVGEAQDPYDVTLPTFIRNIIHHPENTNNSYTIKQLEKSILLLRKIYSRI